MNSLGNEHCWAEIHRAALRHNARVARECSGAELLAVVKANGYGHGAIEVARALREDAALFGVANLREAEELREGGLPHPILILGPALPNEFSRINEHGFIPSVSSAAEARAFITNPSGVSFVIDSGMGRMGSLESEALPELEALAKIERLKLHSISTHLPVADEDRPFTEAQLDRFQLLVRQVRARISGDYKVHALLSAGVLGYAARHRFDIVRAGLMLYGSSPLLNEQNLLRPAMAWKTRVALLRDLPAGHGVSYGRTFVTPRPMRVATICAGYADGIPRALSNRGAEVLLRGRRCAVLGRVTMDLTMIDASAVPDAQPGDEVVLLGRQGAEEIFAAEMAERAGTIAWEIFTGVGQRVRRVYL